MTDISDWISAEVTRVLNAELDLIETEVEAALQTGTDGVAVIREDGKVYVKHMPQVPYGNLYEFPSFESFRLYLERATP
jgi:hypothetical protein